MKKIVLILFFIILLTGCNNKEQIKITMNCKGTTTEVTVKEDNKLSCNLLGDEYEFTIDKIRDDSVTISTNKDGISTGPGILESEKKWVIKKGEKLIIHTNSTDWQDEVEFSW